MEFVAWKKISRLHRDWEITEKVDGTNGVLYWTHTHDHHWDGTKILAKEVVEGEPLYLLAGSRNRWLTTGEDNFGFARWATDNAVDLVRLGPGRHFGEWYGHGIQRGYGLDHKRFALFDQKWARDETLLPEHVDVVPVLLTIDGHYLNDGVREAIAELRSNGSVIAPGFNGPEGVVARHKQDGGRFKALVEGDEIPKGLANDNV